MPDMDGGEWRRAAPARRCAPRVSARSTVGLQNPPRFKWALMNVQDMGVSQMRYLPCQQATVFRSGPVCWEWVRAGEITTPVTKNCDRQEEGRYHLPTLIGAHTSPSQACLVSPSSSGPVSTFTKRDSRAVESHRARAISTLLSTTLEDVTECN